MARGEGQVIAPIIIPVRVPVPVPTCPACHKARHVVSACAHCGHVYPSRGYDLRPDAAVGLTAILSGLAGAWVGCFRTAWMFPFGRIDTQDRVFATVIGFLGGGLASLGLIGLVGGLIWCVSTLARTRR